MMEEARRYPACGARAWLVEDMFCSNCGMPFYNCCDDVEYCERCLQAAQRYDAARGKQGVGKP